MIDKKLGLSKPSTRVSLSRQPVKGKGSAITASTHPGLSKKTTHVAQPAKPGSNASMDPATRAKQEKAPSKLAKKSAPQSTSRKKTIAKQKMACMDYLLETYPAVFSFKHPKPLKIGINQDVIETEIEFPKYILSSVFWSYTHRQSYLKALIKGAVRIDLLGQGAGVVDAIGAAQALVMLEQKGKTTAGNKQASSPSMKMSDPALAATKTTDTPT